MKSKRVRILVAAAVLFVSISRVSAVIEFNDGGVWNIDYEINDYVWIDYQSPGIETTVNVFAGGGIPYNFLDYYLESFENGIINVSGGSINSLDARGASQVTVSAGTIHRSLCAYDHSQVAFSDGTIGGSPGLLGDGLVAMGNSQVTFSGGSLYNPLYARDNSQVAVSGGVMDLLYAIDSSQVAVSGGTVGRLLQAFDSSEVTVCGGSITWDLHAYGSSDITVSGGSMLLLGAHNSSHIAISGGSIGARLEAYDNSEVIISGGLLGKLRLSDSAVLTIEGSDFRVDDTPIGYIELSSVFGLGWAAEPYRRLTGTLISGDPIDSNFFIGNSARIVLVPEPSTLLLLGFGVLIRGRIRKSR